MTAFATMFCWKDTTETELAVGLANGKCKIIMYYAEVPFISFLMNIHFYLLSLCQLQVFCASAYML